MSFVNNYNDNAVSSGIFVYDQKQLDALKIVMEKNNFKVNAEVITSAGSSAIAKINSFDMTTLKAVIIDLKDQDDPFRFVKDITGRLSRDAVIFAIGSNSDVTFFRQLRGYGVSDYFLDPAPAEELVGSLKKIFKMDTRGKGHLGTMISVYGVAGGVGASLLTAALGTILSQKHGRASILVDTNMYAPSVGAYLGSEKAGNLKNLLDAGNRMDSALVSQAVSNIIPNLGLLDSWQSLDSTSSPYKFTGDDVDLVVNHLGNIYRYQIWKANGLNVLRVPALSNSDIIILVLNGTLPSARATQHTLKYLEESGNSARIITVYNNVSPNQAITPKYLEDAIGRAIDYEIPYEKKLSDDMLKNVSFASESHSLYSSISAISNDLLGIRATEEKKGFMRLFK